MEQLMWQICEFEDDTKSFLEFTVSSVPENWFVTINGTLCCYWPKKNVEQKIRRQTCPQDDNNWAMYKCRILMDGEKFPTYKEAVEAEKIAQNYTIVDEGNQKESDSQNCNSTMEFDVSTVSVESDQSESSDTDDSCDLTVKLGPCFKKIYRASDWNVSDISDYASDFKPNSAGFFTSTLLDENEIERELETNDKKIVRSIISTIEYKASSFIADLSNNIKQIQELVKENEKSDDGSSVASSSVQRASVDSNNSEQNQSHDENFDQQPIQKPDQKARTDETFRVEKPPANEYLAHEAYVGEIVCFDQPTLDSHEISARVACPDNSHFDQSPTDKYPVRKAYMNETFCFEKPPAESQEKPAQEGDQIGKTMRVRILNIEEFRPTVGIDLTLNGNERFAQETVKEKADKAVIQLPVDFIVDFDRNEELVEENADLGDALIEHLSPYDFESETNYMNRTILTVSTENFLLEHVSWKNEKNRVLIRDSNILRCWKESYAKQFAPDDDNSKFKGHFRRLKSSIRAGQKNKAKKAKKMATAHRKH